MEKIKRAIVNFFKQIGSNDIEDEKTFKEIAVAEGTLSAEDMKELEGALGEVEDKLHANAKNMKSGKYKREVENQTIMTNTKENKRNQERETPERE